jgi:hypothetical protein
MFPPTDRAVWFDAKTELLLAQQQAVTDNQPANASRNFVDNTAARIAN